MDTLSHIKYQKDEGRRNDMSPATITLLFLLFAIVMFVWEKIPLGVTSMIICVGLVVTGVLDWKTAFAGFIDSNVILFVAMFIVGGALFETGMANKIGGVVTHFAKTERQLIIAIMIIVGLMSGVLSNTGTAAVLIPVVIGIAAKSGYSRSRLLMPLVFAAAMGGNLSLIGAPGNLIAQSVMEEMDMGFGFFEYAKVGLPILVCGIIYFAFFGYKLLPNKTGGTDSSYDEQKDFSNVPKWKQALSLIILILTLLGMIFEDQIGIKLCITGCIGALALILTGVISEKNALKSIDLKTIFLFGGTLSLASALQTTGAGEDIAKAVIGVLGENRTDGSNLCFHCTGDGSRSKSSAYGMCHRRFLCICNTNRYAGKHDGCDSRRIYFQRLRKSRCAADPCGNCSQHDFTANLISVFSISGY